MKNLTLKYILPLVTILSFLTTEALPQSSKDNLLEIPASINPAIWAEVKNIPFIDTHEHIIDESVRLGDGEKFLQADDWT
ncbi:MAG: hypothetical protein GXO81_04150, partial [Chlorobi bacterium]|nr:hypothetical protein [Chlorobiota bacterium]